VRRRLFTLASVVSLLLCVATVVLWVCSYWRLDTIGFTYRRWDTTTNPKAAVWYGVEVELGTTGGTAIVSIKGGRGGYFKVPSVFRALRAEPEGITLWCRNYDQPYSPSELVDGSLSYWRHEAQFPWLVEGPFRLPRSRVLSMPVWTVCLLLLVLPTGRAVTIVRVSKRSREGHCPTCDYDLSGNVSGICPECGKPTNGKLKVPA